MAKICDICEKRPQVGNLVSHANNRVKRWVYPNVHRLRYKHANSADNCVKQGHVCTRCVKAGKVVKVV